MKTGNGAGYMPRTSVRALCAALKNIIRQQPATHAHQHLRKLAQQYSNGRAVCCVGVLASDNPHRASTVTPALDSGAAATSGM